MKKKILSNGGYALAYVLVVMTVILAIAGGLSVSSVSNVKTQETAVSRMKARYEAAGEVEKIFTKIAEFKVTIPIPDLPGSSPNEEKVGKKLGELLETLITNAGSAVMEVTGSANMLTITLQQSSTDDTTTIAATLGVNYTVTSNADNTKYTAAVTRVTYQSYDVTYGG